VTQTRAKLARMSAEVDRWEDLSLGIDRED
jgi:hypothetical protein